MGQAFEVNKHKSQKAEIQIIPAQTAATSFAYLKSPKEHACKGSVSSRHCRYVKKKYLKKKKEKNMRILHSHYNFGNECQLSQEKWWNQTSGTVVLCWLWYLLTTMHMIASKQNKNLVCKGRGIVFFNVSFSFHTHSFLFYRSIPKNMCHFSKQKCQYRSELILNMDEIRDSALQISEQNSILRCIITLTALL